MDYLFNLLFNTNQSGGKKTERNVNKITAANKRKIAKKLKNISEQEAINDFYKLEKINLKKISNETRIGNKFVDYFTFPQRLETTSKKGMTFFEFLTDKNYHEKKYIKNLIQSQNDKDKDITLYRVFKLHCGSIGIFKPVTAMEMYSKFKPNSVLDFTMGWGGRLVGACALNLKNYIGIDSNKKLKTPYGNMVKLLKELNCQTNIKLIFDDALNVDYSKLHYDCVLTSPPYFNLEIYEGMQPRSQEDWINYFYIPIFSKTFKHLKKGGHYILNISHEIYKSAALPTLGKANITIPLKKKSLPKNSKLTKDYSEFIYVWKK